MLRLAATLLAILTVLTCTQAAPLTLVQDGKSNYAIFLAPDAPASVKAAAADLQTYFERVTGARLPLVDKAQDPMISLGVAPAGVPAKPLPLEAYRLVTQGANLYVYGPDTADGTTTPQGGTSNGTANGVYAFIEATLGVRWLMPGEYGDYVPSLKTITLPETDNTSAPFFQNRRVPYTQENRPETKRWWARQGLGHSLFLAHSHNWQHFTLEDFKAHPEWFAEHGGQRMAPLSDRFKLCTTNDGLVREFANRAIKHFDANPAATCYSLSPTDSAGWCECANCKALYEQDPDGQLSVTPAVIDFYNRVAALVAAKYPDKLLAGYIYAQYVYPPTKPFKLAGNVFLVWAPSFDYGFTLFRPDIQQRWDALVPQWLKVTSNLSYYDLPNCIHNDLGAINPPALKILKWLYPRLKRAGMKGVYVYGAPAWGYAGPMNYLLAKLAWNPDADVDALFDEYIAKTYAEGAPEIKRLYLLMDDETEKYFNANHNEAWTLSDDRIRTVYGANFPELEKLYRAAESRITDPDAKARLAMLGANLTILHWNLRQLKAVDSPEASTFYLPDKDFFAFLKPWTGSFAITPPARTAPGGVGEKLAVRPLPVSKPQPVIACKLRGGQRLVLKPMGADPAVVSFSSITSRGRLMNWQLHDAAGALVDQGVMTAETPVLTPAAGSDFYVLSLSGGASIFSLTVKNAAWAVSSKVDAKGLHFLGLPTPLYFEVPEGVTSFDLFLSSDAPGETAAARLCAPDGTEVTTFRTVEKTIDSQVIKVAPGQSGVWSFISETPDKGAVDDVYLKFGAQLSGYVSLDPQAALGVTVSK